MWQRVIRDREPDKLAGNLATITKLSARSAAALGRGAAEAGAWGGLAHLREGRELLLDEEAGNLKAAKEGLSKNTRI